MKPLGWNLNHKTKPYDYRVAFFERAKGSSVGSFVLPCIKELNPLADNVEPIRSELTYSADFEYSVHCSIASGADISGDRKAFGSATFYGLYIIGNCWRPGGVDIWPHIPTYAEFPLVTGVVTRLRVVPRGYNLSDGLGNFFSVDYTHNPVGILVSIHVLRSPDAVNNYAFPGFRYFESSVRNSHPKYGFNAKYICVMKDGEPFIFDTVSGLFYPKVGGDIVIGPKVPDNFNPLEFVE